MFSFRLILTFLIWPSIGSFQEIAESQKLFSFQESYRIEQAILTRQRQRNESFRQIRENYIFDESANEITQLPANDLIQKLQTRSLNATQVLKAYIAKAIMVQDKFNCITEFVPFAMEKAQTLDEQRTVQGPFHGVPICIKDDNDVIGMDTTQGLGKNLNKPALSNSVLAQSLLDLGAVAFCRTNIPQTVFRYSSDNPIYGETVNHLNVKLSPGGSSSGTASLIGAGGAVFATGTDIAGSLRIPAHFSGICSLKPTRYRLSDKGVAQPIPKLIGLSAIPGIMAKDIGTVAAVFKALLTDSRQNVYDASAVPIPWNDELFESKAPLRFGYYTSLSFFPPIGDTVSVVLSAKSELENLGHEVVPFKIENDFDIVKLISDVVAVDYGTDSHLKQLFANEPPARGVEMLRSTCGKPDWRRRLDYHLSDMTQPGSSEYSARGALLLHAGIDQHRDRDVWDLIYQRKQLISKLLTQMQEANLDLILTPAFPFPACRLNDTEALFGATVYTMTYNFVDFPAGVIPFGVETGQNIDNYNDEGDALLRLAQQTAKASIGSPIGVQIIGKPFNEEQVLRALRELFNSKMASSK